jgi:histone acetyltransferase (RNA polymerase elongator complex component)
MKPNRNAYSSQSILKNSGYRSRSTTSHQIWNYSNLEAVRHLASNVNFVPKSRLERNQMESIFNHWGGSKANSQNLRQKVINQLKDKVLEHTYKKRKTVTSKHMGRSVLPNENENEHKKLTKEQIIAKAKIRQYIDTENHGKTTNKNQFKLMSSINLLKTLQQFAKFKNLLPLPKAKIIQTQTHSNVKNIPIQKSDDCMRASIEGLAKKLIDKAKVIWRFHKIIFLTFF